MISVCLIICSCWAISLLDQDNRVSIHPLHPKKGDAHTKPNSSYHFTCVRWVICNCQLMRTWVVALENYACFSRLLLATWIITYMRFNKCKYWHAFERRRVTARRTESGKARLPIHALVCWFNYGKFQFVLVACCCVARARHLLAKLKDFVFILHTLFEFRLKFGCSLTPAQIVMALLRYFDAIENDENERAMVDTLLSDFQWIACELLRWVFALPKCHWCMEHWTEHISRVSLCPSSNSKTSLHMPMIVFVPIQKFITWSYVVSN